MKKLYPSPEEAEKIMLEVVKYRRNKGEVPQESFYNEGEFIVHSWNVGKVAMKIASKTAYLNPEKAYVLGLLHDYGKRLDEKLDAKFHGLDGYEEMMKRGYDDVARVCLTHTFPDKDFKERSFWYPKEWQDGIKNLLNTIEYDDYDRLIQLSDKFSEALDIIKIEPRVEEISKRYNLDDKSKEVLLKEGMKLKKYFNELCGEDIYDILGI